jgi:hypothetical protein
LPGFPQLVAVEEPQESADDEQRGLIERSRHGRESKCATPSQGSWDATVPNDDFDCANRSGDEGSCRAQAPSLGREWHGSRSCERLTRSGLLVCVTETVAA